METVKRLKYLVIGYLVVLFFLLLCVSATPLLIRHSFTLRPDFIIDEEVLETILIVLLFGMFFIILIGFRRALKAYERAVSKVNRDKSKLMVRLSEAFRYIGAVNIEIKEIESVLNGPDYYPQTKKEFKQLIDHLAFKIMLVAGVPWAVIRMISRGCGRTIMEHAAENREGILPSATMGNREILEGRHVQGLRTICARRNNLDLLTVCILPTVPLAEENIVLITAIINEIEMLFLLHRAGCLRPDFLQLNDHTEKEVCHDTHH